jgi:multidrug resistance efflux pump
METLLMLTYIAICVVIFKVFKIPLNKWTVPTAVLGGILLIGALIFTMNYNHPYSEITRNYFVTVPIVPEVTGQVIDVPVRPNQQLKKGDVLLKLDPVPFEDNVAKLKAQLDTAKKDLARAKQLVKTSALAQRELDLAQAQVNELTPQLATAQWELDNTTVRAPGNGYVTQVSVRPGVMAAKLPLKPVMTFVPYEPDHYIGWFRQNSTLRLKAGYKAEIALDSIPGQVFSAHVKQVLPALAEGQFNTNGVLVDDSTSSRAGRVAVELVIDDPAFIEYRLSIPAGLYGQAAIYSDHAHHFAIIRKILLRMSAWMNYIFPFH